jgi:serine phosphatase RsbU (regulator of sigma subunit)
MSVDDRRGRPLAGSRAARVSPLTGVDVRAPGDEGEQLRLLLVEDDDGDALLVSELLADSGLSTVVRRAVTLAEAVAALAAEAGQAGLAGGTDCVLLDLGLPDAHGLTGLERLLATDSNAAVLVLTGLHDESRGSQAVAAGAQDYLVKDQVDGTSLARAVRYAVTRRRAEESQRALLASRLQQKENTRLERGLLPVPVLRDDTLSCVPRYRPGRAQALLGGDFYDVVQTQDRSLIVIIGDVAGHGPDSAALGVHLRVAWRTLVLAGHQPPELLPILSRVLEHDRASVEMFATACQLVVSPDARSAAVFTAGHPGPLLLGTPTRPLLELSPGPALGIVSDWEWEPAVAALPADWTLMLYTDGLIEGHVRDGTERLGEEGLAELTTKLALDCAGAGALADALVETVQRLNGGPLADDIALLLISGRRRADGPDAG